MQFVIYLVHDGVFFFFYFNSFLDIIKVCIYIEKKLVFVNGRLFKMDN